MKSNFKSLVEFSQEVTRRENAKKDWLVPTKELYPYENNNELRLLSYLSNEPVFDSPVNKHAQHQLASIYGIPIKYWESMKEIPHLRAKNLEAWFNEKQSTRMIRELDGDIRAVVSNRFKPFDNFIVINAMMPVLSEYKSDMIINANVLTEKKMYLQIRFPSIETEIADGDKIQAGLIITNSEVGAGSVDIRESIWRVICSNGMIRESIFRKFHVGSRMSANEEDYNIYKEDTLEHEMKALTGKIRDITSYALETQNFDKSIEPLRNAANRKFDDTIKTVQNVTKHFNIPDSYQNAMNKYLYESNDNSQWDVANAITALAHDSDNPDKAYDFEVLGNDLVKFTDSQWEKLIN